MPQLKFPVTRAGLEVPVWIGLDHKAAKALEAAGRSVPPPVLARGVLDTGTSVTAVALWVLQQLAVSPTTTTSTQTAAGKVPVDLYEVSLSITDPADPVAPMLTFPTLLVSGLMTVLPDADVLIGLDVLLECKLLVDGPARRFTLDF
jgi:hypothetical protein